MMKKLLVKVRNYVVDKLLLVTTATLVVAYAVSIYASQFSDYAVECRVRAIYAELWRQTGQTQEMIPLEIVDSPIINAYNDGNRVIIYTGLIKSTGSWDEVALVLGHEIAHGNLWHLRMMNEWNVINAFKADYEVSVLEANADKLGAVYMMKAGYNICKGREMFKSWLNKQGDYQGGNHPGYAYRYNELNINCD